MRELANRAMRRIDFPSESVNSAIAHALVGWTRPGNSSVHPKTAAGSETRPLHRMPHNMSFRVDAISSFLMIGCSERLRGYRFWCCVYLLAALAGLLLTICLIYVTGWVTFNLAFKLALVAWTPYLLTAPLVWRLARRFPLERAVWRRHLWIHLPATVAFIALAEALQLGVAATVLKLPPPRLGAKLRCTAHPPY